MKAAGQSYFVPVMTWFRLVLVVGMLAGGAGCKPKIGEDCATSVDCSISGDRLCDVTQPSGYCTVFNCEPNLCPDEAACVAFSEGTCSSATISTRFRRTFCMRTCEEDSDCRGGSYRCIDISNDLARRVVDTNPPNRRICAVPSPNQAPPTSDPAVCFPSDASFDVSRPEAGPTSPDVSDAKADADAAESSAADRTDDGADASGPETGIEASTDDALDSSRVETGGDAADEPETTDD